MGKMGIQWTRENAEKLIALYKDKRELWDPVFNDTGSGYLNREKRDKTYDSIVDAMEQYMPKITAQDIHLKIRSIRDQLRKEMKMMEEKRSIGDDVEPRLWCYEQLKFLVPIEETRMESQLNVNYRNPPPPSSYKSANAEQKPSKKKPKYWSRPNTLKLIELFEEKRELWDIQEEGFPNTVKRRAAYKAIRNTMREFFPKLKLSDVRKRISNIRSQFRFELNQIRKEKNPTCKPRLWCFEQMQFLGPILDKDLWSEINVTKNDIQDTSLPLSNASETESPKDTICTSTQANPSKRVTSNRRKDVGSRSTTCVLNSDIPKANDIEMELTNVCRICLKPIATLPVILPISIQQFLACDLNLRYLSIVDLRPELPQNVCSECYDSCANFQRFYAKCSQANEFLKEKLEAFVKDEVDEEVSGNEDGGNYTTVETINITPYTDLQSSNDENECGELVVFDTELQDADEGFMMEREYEEDEYVETLETLDDSDADVEMYENIDLIENEANSNSIVFDESQAGSDEDIAQHQEKNASDAANSRDGSDSDDSPDERPFACKYCEKTFTQNNKLRSHELIHTNTKPFICHVCGKSFRQSSTYNTHLTQHFGKPFECGECGKRFPRRTQLNIHSRRHRNEYPFRCDFEGCKAAYIRRSRLTDHKLTHLASRPHVCELCGSSFHHRNALGNHMSRVHPSMTYRCPECNKCNSMPARFRKHLETAHGINLEDVSHLKIALTERPKRQRGMRKSLREAQQ